VKAAVDRATGTATSGYSSGAAKLRDNAERSIALDQQVTDSQAAAQAAGAAQNSAGASAAGAAAGQAALQQKLLEMQNNMLDHYERLERDQQGFATINSLLAVIGPMQNLPGRKTIILFSEGLKLPPTVMQKFPSVINAANKANVSIYAIDAAGLRVEGGTTEAAREINSLATARLQQQGRNAEVSGPFMRSLERNEDLLRFDPRSGLGQLADQTGGVLIHDTNDLSAGVRRINDDMHGYYMLSYIPQNKDYDGRFRQITVKINKPNIEVQSRKGYYAIESVGQLPVLDFEAPAIAAARHITASSGKFPFHGAAFSYPSDGRPGLTLFMAETALSSFKFVPSNDTKTFNADFSIVALVRDEAGQIIQKLSQHYPMSGPLTDLDNARKGDLLFYREAQLPPGKYKVELIAYDAASTSTSVSITPLDIAGADATKPRVSSVSILKRAERLTPEEQKRDQPFRFGELLVYPNLGEPIARSTTKQLAFFFTAWPAKGSNTPLQLTLEILQNKHDLGKISGALPQPDSQGQIKYASSIPLDKFQPGVFELKVTVTDGKNTVSRSTQFTVDG
jgi:VWFA-related protein